MSIHPKRNRMDTHGTMHLWLVMFIHAQDATLHLSCYLHMCNSINCVSSSFSTVALTLEIMLWCLNMLSRGSIDSKNLTPWYKFTAWRTLQAPYILITAPKGTSHWWVCCCDNYGCTMELWSVSEKKLQVLVIFQTFTDYKVRCGCDTLYLLTYLR